MGNQFDWGREDYVAICSRVISSSSSSCWTARSSWSRAKQTGSSSSRDYGPTKVLADSLDDEQREELHRDFVELHERSRVNGGIHFSRTYLLAVGTRR